MLSDILVYYYLARFLMYESPLDFQASVTEKKPQTVGFMDLECSKNNLKQL